MNRIRNALAAIRSALYIAFCWFALFAVIASLSTIISLAVNGIFQVFSGPGEIFPFLSFVGAGVITLLVIAETRQKPDVAQYSDAPIPIEGPTDARWDVALLV